MDIGKMSLEEKVGQMVMCGFDGQTASAEIIDLIENYHIGGVIYFSRNVKNTKQVYELSRKLQEINTNAGKGEHPLFVSIDQEGGMVARILDGVTLMLGNMAVSATDKVEYAYETAKICGIELQALGVNVNFAPSIDVNNNRDNPVIGVRSYGSDPEQVSKMGVAQINGYQDAGVSATAKHFPGHGDTNVDSHLDLPTIPHDLQRMHEVELYPFKKAIDAGVDGIMTAHVVFSELDEKTPCTLSEKIITDLLRKELAYNGVVFTDCMEMKAIADYFGTAEAAVEAVKAGVDVVLVSHTYELQKRTIEKLIDSVKSGDISEDRIDESVARIIALKEKRMSKFAVPASWEEAQGFLEKEEHKRYVQQVRDECITVVKNEGEGFPIQPNKKTFVVWPKTKRQSDVDEIGEQRETLGTFLKERGEETAIEEIVVSVNPEDWEIERVLSGAKDHEQVIVCTYNATHNEKQVQLVKILLQVHPNLTVVALRNPYDIQEFTDVKNFVASYETRPLTVYSAAKVLTGEIEAKGKLPVKL